MARERADDEQRRGYAPSVWTALLSILLLLCGLGSSAAFVLAGEWGWALFAGPLLWAMAALVRKW